MKIPLAILLRLTALAILLAGCSGSDDPPPATDVTGSWNTTTWIDAYAPGPGVNVSWTLVQTGSAVQGSFRDHRQQGGTVSGSVSGYEVFLACRYGSAAVVDVEGVVNDQGTVMDCAFRGAGEVKLGAARRQLAH